MGLKVKKMRGPWPRTCYAVALDLGQSVDASALTVVEKLIEPVSDFTSLLPVEVQERFNVRHAERLPQGMSYVQQVRYVSDIMQRQPLSLPVARSDNFQAYVQRARPGEATLPQRTRLNTAPTKLIVDATGVGRPVMDLFRQGGLKPVGITITAGRQVVRRGNDWHVPKLELVSRMQSLLHSGKLQIAEGLPETQALAEEMADFRATFTAAGNPQFAATGTRHDDMVLSLSLALFFLADNALKFTRKPLSI